jgi:hypothetical protein
MKGIGSIDAVLATLGLATAMHLDWHAARPAEHHLSLGWTWHWLLAVPVCALTAWYVARAWPRRRVAASVAIFGTASILAAVVEPLWEYLVDGATLEWTFGRMRLVALAAFLITGLITHAALVNLGAARWSAR